MRISFYVNGLKRYVSVIAVPNKPLLNHSSFWRFLRWANSHVGTSLMDGRGRAAKIYRPTQLCCRYRPYIMINNRWNMIVIRLCRSTYYYHLKSYWQHLRRDFNTILSQIRWPFWVFFNFPPSYVGLWLWLKSYPYLENFRAKTTSMGRTYPYPKSQIILRTPGIQVQTSETNRNNGLRIFCLRASIIFLLWSIYHVYSSCVRRQKLFTQYDQRCFCSFSLS